MSEHETVTCECGKPADAEYVVWNGRDHLPVCSECWVDPETIATEACVCYQEGKHTSDGSTLEECVRVECGFRDMPWTPELQAHVDKRYLEWYLEEAK